MAWWKQEAGLWRMKHEKESPGLTGAPEDLGERMLR